MERLGWEGEKPKRVVVPNDDDDDDDDDDGGGGGDGDILRLLLVIYLTGPPEIAIFVPPHESNTWVVSESWLS